MRKVLMKAGKKAGIYLAVGVLAATALTACGKGTGESATQPAEQTTSGDTAGDSNGSGASGAESEALETEELKSQASGTIKASTNHGEVELPVNPGRVVVFDMGILDSLDYLGVEAEYAVPTANLLDNLSKYQSSVNAGGIKEPDMETIYEFEPDLIIISGRQEAFYEELSKIAPTWDTSMDYSNLMEDFVDIYTTLGQVFDREEEVASAIRTIETQIGETAEKANQAEKKALILLTNDGSISAYGSGSRFGMIHDILGVKAADTGIEASTHGQSVGFEYIAQVNPDILFVVDRTAIVAGTTNAGDTLENELVESTNAYKNGKVVYLDAENWYLAGTALRTFPEMIGEVAGALQ
ncbi:MAG: ABC transporter substrate-binding protein [Hungatella hathewayi]|nr:ABC transporter substrate-binding protein [Hungatella hathewayi]